MPRSLAVYLAVLGTLTGAVLIAAVLLFVEIGPHDPAGRQGEKYAYDVISWELRSLPQKWLYEIGGIFRGGSDLSDDEALARYFELGTTAQPDLKAARDERAGLENRVEAIIEGRITSVLEDEGLAMEMPLFSDLGIIFPPVDFELDSTPRVLAVSPRDRIDLDESYLLKPDVDVATAYEIEDESESENSGDSGVSARVLATGGVATYPAVLNESDPYRELIRTAFHEWTHQYLVFFPLGRSYFAGDDARTINETVATVAGDRLARLYFDRYDDLEPDDSGEPVDDGGSDEPAFDFSAEMRDLRRDVEAMLADGQIAEAEALMDSKRDEFEENGYHVRKINQAYFAYRGFYATSAGSIDPLGPNIEELYTRSGSPGAFLRLMQGVTTRSEVDGLLAD
jgi:hypothetical protein